MKHDAYRGEHGLHDQSRTPGAFPIVIQPSAIRRQFTSGCAHPRSDHLPPNANISHHLVKLGTLPDARNRVVIELPQAPDSPTGRAAAR